MVDNNLKPLVTILLITYNSDQYVLETLESIKTQNYSNIELIISDDCSKDTTISICEKWLEKNKTVFKNAEIITVVENTGIPKNCNRGLYKASGDWIKIIAGDDTLKKDCISSNVEFIVSNPNAKFIDSKCDVFANFLIDQNFLGSEPRPKRAINFEMDNKEQYKKLLKLNFVWTPSMFINKDVLIKLGGFDTEFRLFEDLPVWLKATSNGYKIHFLDKPTVNYRIHDNSVSKKAKPHMNAQFAEEKLKFKKIYLDKNINPFFSFKYGLRYKLMIFLDKNGFNNTSRFSSFLYKIVGLLNYF